MKDITLIIDGRKVKTEEGKTVLEAALNAGIYIPTLCYHPDLSPFGACRLCIVEIEGMRGLPTSCTTAATEGMVVKTKTPQVDRIRRIAMELMLAAHPADCLVCAQNLNCELQAVAQYLGITEQRLRIKPKDTPVNDSNPLIVHDLSKCILCGRCIRACNELRKVGVLSFIKRGRDTYVGTAFDRPLADIGCRFCGACIEVCPTGAIRDKDGLLVGWDEREKALVPCKHACPAEIDVPRYIRFIKEGKYAEATAVIREKVPFPHCLGDVCAHPCETVCRRGTVNEPISIRMLKRFAAEKDSGMWKKNSKKAPATGKRVAVLGAGPAGLTAAYYLAKLGHGVTVFEALPATGGMMRVGVPEYRLPRKVLDAEVEEIKQLGVEIKTNARVDTLDDLFKQGYNAIFLGIGAHQGSKMSVKGKDSPGVLLAIDFLRDVSLGQKPKLGKKVAVIGGGNVARDAARTALRLGAKDITIVYRRTRAEMPASAEAIEGALEEGVKIAYLTAPSRIWNENGIVKLECTRMELVESHDGSRKHPVPIKGSEFITDYDTIIAAIGQSTEIPSGFRVAAERGNTIKTDSTSVTSREGVFAGGDAVSGPGLVIEAIAAGRNGAIAIDKYLGGSGIISEELAPVEEPKPCLGRGDGFAKLQREQMPCLEMEKRLDNFSEIELGYEEEAAVKEATRCLQCDLRLKITPVKYPPKRGTTKGSR